MLVEDFRLENQCVSLHSTDVCVCVSEKCVFIYINLSN